ncbi:MAG TPA: sugar ABC transporter ATP-binding protein [Sphaerochaeta sp.]|nr:sugar ABC transporter ATP-binding protein [Sphaerochaeta sp.]
MSEFVLRLANISKSFVGVKALQDVHLDLKKGEVHALLGENGAGKSTLMKVLSGVYQPDCGTIEMNGKPVHFSNPQMAKDAGIGIIFQEFSLIPHLTVTQNIFLGRELKNKIGMMDSKKMHSIAIERLHDLNVDIDPHSLISELSIAKQQFVEIVKAVSDEVKVLILDEPTATLTPGEVKQLFTLMRTLQKKEVSMIFISHHLDDVYEIADSVTCLRDGQYIDTSLVKDVEPDDLVRKMVGRTVSQSFPPKPPYAEIEKREVLMDATVQRIKTTSKQGLVLHKGEILGISGLVGAGRTELIRSLIGADKSHFKRVTYHGKDIRLTTPHEALTQGIGLVPEDRKTQGLILPFSICDNIVINTLNKTAKRGLWIDHKNNVLVSNARRDELSIKTPSVDQLVQNLSGGNQQKVAIAKWLTTRCDLLIFDEPTRGIDVGAKAEIYLLMRALVKSGISIIMISSELPEVIGLSDKVVVMRNDEIVATLTEQDINSELIMNYATGGKKHGQPEV